jgi:hypothetical protein
MEERGKSRRLIGNHVKVGIPAIADDCFWPRAGAPSIDFVATLLTAALHPKRLFWSRQIE